MKHVAMLAVAAALAGTSMVQAQTAGQPTAPATEIVKPSLISDITIRAGDSPLVRAAKTAVATRIREASRSTGVLISDAYVRNSTGGRISEAHSSAPLPSFGQATPRQGGSASTMNLPNIIGVNRAGVERQNQQLRQEQGRAFEESMQPWGGDVSEDRATQRLTQIPQEIQKNEQKLNNQRP